MTQYGPTSLTPEQGTAERILMLCRGHWTIENLSHRPRDVLFDENASQVRYGNGPQMMSALRNATVSLMRTSGNTVIASAFRYFAANLRSTHAFRSKYQQLNASVYSLFSFDMSNTLCYYLCEEYRL